MNCIIYNFLPNKQINGTLFYGFEYYAFLKPLVPDLKFILFNATTQQLDYIKSILLDKYNIDDSILVDMVNITKHSDILKLKIKNAMILDLRTYSVLKPFLKDANIKVYSNKTDNLLNDKHTFYGFYDYQHYHKKTRLKFYIDIHKTFSEKGDKLFVSSLNGDNEYILKRLELDPDETLVKTLNEHNTNLFSKINGIIYWHTGAQDVNNRIVVESYIHDIPLQVLLNGHNDDSVKERYDTLQHKNGLDQFILTEDDIMIKDFLDDVLLNPVE